MSFWSSQSIEAEQKKHRLIAPFKESHLKHGAYQLALSREVLTTPDGSKDVAKTGEGPTLGISAGQFAILYTEETVTIPDNVIGFISMKSELKFKGLVNVSGFHVDPGYSGHLKFTVFNSGNKPIHLGYDTQYFPIWFAELDQPTRDPYSKEGLAGRITTFEREEMSERRHSPDTLHQRLKKLENKVTGMWAVMIMVFAPAIICITVAIVQHWYELKPNEWARSKDGLKTNISATLSSQPTQSQLSPSFGVSQSLGTPLSTPTNQGVVPNAPPKR